MNCQNEEKSLITECSEMVLKEIAAEKKRFEECRELINQVELESIILSQWLVAAGQSLPLRIGHFFTELKHALCGKTKEERRNSWRWLLGNRGSVSSYNYIHQSSVCSAKIQESLKTLKSYVDSNWGNASEIEYKKYCTPDLKDFESMISQYNHHTVLVCPSLVDWNIPLFQRPQQIALALAGQGILVIYETKNSMYDNIHEVKQLSNNLFLVPTERFIPVMRILQEKRLDIFLDIYSTDMNHSMNWINSFEKQGCHILYEYVDEISVNGK